MYKTLLFHCFSLFVTAAHAQDDWLITTKLDTISGKIFLDHGGPYQADEARVKNDDGKSNYKAYHVRSVYLGENDVYQTMKIDERYQFVKTDVAGKYFTQYLYLDPESGNTTNYALKILVNWKGDMYKISNLINKKKFATFFADCQSVSDSIISGSLKKKDLKKIFELYDECIDRSRVDHPVASTVSIRQAESIKAFIANLKSSGLYNDDLSSMIDDISQKLNNQQSIPKYLQQAVLEQLAESEELTNKFEALIKDN